MSYTLQVFVSSTCYDLRDLRASIKSWLENLGVHAILSEESGFPRSGGQPPYVECLRVLENSQMVIGIIDRKYGTSFENWGKYTQYKGISPTHAELRHALSLKKKILLYIHKDTINNYQLWRKNSEQNILNLPAGFEVGTLELVKELKLYDPAPWIEPFNDINDVINSLKKNFINEIFTGIKEKEKQDSDLTQYVLDLILSTTPEIRAKIEDSLNPELKDQLNNLNAAYKELETNFVQQQEESNKTMENLIHEKNDILKKIESTETELTKAKVILLKAAIRDFDWLTLVRSTLMPKQPGRIPFHNQAEVALRGYHCHNDHREKPILQEVTWSLLLDKENNLRRGYKAGLIFKGKNFQPGITFTSRRKGEEKPTLFWNMPSIYFGDYLEVAQSDDIYENPLCWNNYEFCVKNPIGPQSDWITFSYNFDFDKLKEIMNKSEEEGKNLFAQGLFKEAIEPLRKASVFSNRIFGENTEETKKRSKLHWEALDKSILKNLRFKEGEKIKVIKGNFLGITGIIKKINLRWATPYEIEPDIKQDKLVAVSDDEVELL